MGVPVTFSPQFLDFGAIMPGSTGPDISTPFGEGVNLAGGINIESAPAAANVTAHITGDTSHFAVRDVSVLEEVLCPWTRASSHPVTKDLRLGS